MKLKWNKVDKNTAIHCKNETEAKLLLELNSKRGGEEFNANTQSTYYETYGENTCYGFSKDKRWSYCDIEWHKSENFNILEFSDLISGHIEMTQEDIEKELGYKIKIIQ